MESKFPIFYSHHRPQAFFWQKRQRASVVNVASHALLSPLPKYITHNLIVPLKYPGSVMVLMTYWKGDTSTFCCLLTAEMSPSRSRWQNQLVVINVRIASFFLFLLLLPCLLSNQINFFLKWSHLINGRQTQLLGNNLVMSEVHSADQMVSIL